MDIENNEKVRGGEGEISIPMDSLIKNGVTNSPSKWGIVRKSLGGILLGSKWSRIMDGEFNYCLQGPQMLIETNTRGFVEKDMYNSIGPRPSIFDVPDSVKLVPIGPYHSLANRENALINVSKKWICAKYLVEYFGLKSVYWLDRFEKEEARVCSYYAESMLPVYTGEVLKELFFLDSCFIWFFICSMVYPYRYRSNPVEANSVDWLQNVMDQHIIPDITSNENQIKIELLMLGNQIPWFLIEIISDSMDFLPMDPLKSTLICFENIYPRTYNYRNFQTPTEGFQHLLHFYHWSLVQNNIDRKYWRNQISLLSRVCKEACNAFNRFSRRIKLGARFIFLAMQIPHSSDYSSSEEESHFFPPTNSDDKNGEDSIDLLKLETSLCVPNAVELHESSTSFRRLWGSDLDIVFYPKILWPSATMHISPLHIFDYSNTIFKHLIKFEQKYRRCGFHVTGYMTCIARLLQSKEDVNQLRKKGILPNTMKNDLEILHFVQEMRVETRGGRVPRDLRNFFRRVTKYHDGNLNRAYGGFKHHYCPNPWITLSVLGGVSLFILTLVQTIYTVIGDKKP